MNSLSRFNHRCILASTVLMVLAAMAAPAIDARETETVAADSQYLVYLPSRSASVDHAANIGAFEENGLSVVTIAYAGESNRDYARRVTAEVRGLIARGAAPESITVVGAGSGSPVAALTSAITGNRHVNYVMLGNCDQRLADDSSFHMSGRVLGLRDADDIASPSCRPLWRNAPKLEQRRDLVVRSGQGAALFDAPHPEWVKPVADWSRGGSVDIGTIRMGSNDQPPGKIVIGSAN
jgi:hypothetical protein